jgi:hypothetical protein
LPVTLTLRLGHAAALHYSFSAAESPSSRWRGPCRPRILGDEPSATHRVFVRNLVFYTGVPKVDLVQRGGVDAFLQSADQRVIVRDDRG